MPAGKSSKVEMTVPLGLKLLNTLSGHEGQITQIAWSNDGQFLVSGSHDNTIKIWEHGNCINVLENDGRVQSLAFDPKNDEILLSAGDKTVKAWNYRTGKLLRKFHGHESGISTVVVHPTENVAISAEFEATTKLWNTSNGECLRTRKQHDSIGKMMLNASGALLACNEENTVSLWESLNGKLKHSFTSRASDIDAFAFSPQQNMLAIGDNYSVRVFDCITGNNIANLEGPTDFMNSIAFSSDGILLIARQIFQRQIHIWRTDSWSYVTNITFENGKEYVEEFTAPNLIFHPKEHLFAAICSRTGKVQNEQDREICVWQYDSDFLLNRIVSQSGHYINAKVVLLGDTGVGKTALSMVLNREPYALTDSTPGRKIWTFNSEVLKNKNTPIKTRETLLWDMAGQPGYRVIHQLHLNEIAVAIIVFDARSEIDPLAGVRHWVRALKLAQQREGQTSVPMKKYLVSARCDRGTVSVSKERLEAIVNEYDLDGYFETSAKEGWKIDELRETIEKSISWDDLPVVSSSKLFSDIKQFLLEIKSSGQLVELSKVLYQRFVSSKSGDEHNSKNLLSQFETCISRLENRGLIRRLSFGGYILLQPELLDAHASAMVNAAKKEPDGLGSIPEDVALKGQFYIPDEQRVKDEKQAQLLLHATVEELVGHDLALRENADDGRYLVFPSEFIRDYEAAPEPKGKALSITFDGPVQSLYSTLAVRLGHSGFFTTGRADMWRNAAVFKAKAGGKCGVYLHEFEEARGRLIIFYDEHNGIPASDETRFNFEEFVIAHANRRAIDRSIDVVRFFVCSSCGDPVPDSYVKKLRERGILEFGCPCGTNVSLAHPEEKLQFNSRIKAMEKSADEQRDLEVFVSSARGEIATPDFTVWAGDDRCTLAIVFTDVVGSTSLGENLKDEGMTEVRRKHFSESRKLIRASNGREIKTIGDSFMTAFKSVEKALDYALALHSNTGHSTVKIRAGIHIGPMNIEENDVFGGAVNFAARVVGAIKGAEIWISDDAKKDLDRSNPKRHKLLKWTENKNVVMKGFKGEFTLWSLDS